MELIKFIFSGFWIFLGSIVLIWLLLYFFVNGLIRIWIRFMRMIQVTLRGWPPAHLDGDGDFEKTESKELNGFE